MSVYLHDIPLQQAKNLFNETLKRENLFGLIGTETSYLSEELVGRILGEPVWAKICSPHYHASAMDGFALRAADSKGAAPARPVSLRVNEVAFYVDTGDPVPDWANAVIPIELVEPLDENQQIVDDIRKPYSIRIRAAAAPWQHIRPMGEDIVATELVLTSGHQLRPVDLGAIAACGHDKVVVSRKPKVGIIPTGTELVEIGQPVKKGDIIEYNALVMAAQVQSWGGEAHRYPITPDDYSLIRERVQTAANENDLVLLNAGSSAGSEDFSADIIASLGEVLVHGIAVRPGHPVILGMIKRSDGSNMSVPIIGVPGYPVSAALTVEIFVEPLLALWLGKNAHLPELLSAKLTRKISSPSGDDDHIRVVVGKVGDRMLAAPLSRGAGVISSLVRADGITVVPSGIQGVEAGDDIQVRLYRSQMEIEKTLFVIGSHDLTIDLLSQQLSLRDRRIVSANVGSLAGLMAIRRGEAHFGGSHLLDPKTGQYNLSYVAKYLPDLPVYIISWVKREQGLMVPKGNPKGLSTVQDLARKDIRFVNRQRGAGTRVLLDFLLEQNQIETSHIQGYKEEVFTHLSVAADVASGRADCGLGIAAAAKALDLDFIHIGYEEYDLVVPAAHYEHDLFSPVKELMANEEFKSSINQLDGYNADVMGEIKIRP